MVVYELPSHVAGPIFGGQIYDRTSNGWIILTWVSTPNAFGRKVNPLTLLWRIQIWFGLLAICIPPSLWYTGDRPLGKRLWNRMKRKRGVQEAGGHCQEDEEAGGEGQVGEEAV
jgi:hypothetical protein